MSHSAEESLLHKLQSSFQVCDFHNWLFQVFFDALFIQRPRSWKPVGDCLPWNNPASKQVEHFEQGRKHELSEAFT